jgi:hypothetical protein
LTLCVFSFQYPDIPAEAPGKGAGKPLHLGREVKYNIVRYSTIQNNDYRIVFLVSVIPY